MNQKLTITLTAVSLSLVAFLSGYLISQTDFHRNTGSSTSGNILDKFSDNNPGQVKQTSQAKALKLLSQRSVLSPALSQGKDGIIYYEKGTGKIFEVSLNDLSDKPVSDVPLNNLVKTIWSPSRKEVVSLFYSPNGSHYKYFSFKTRASVDLGTNIKSLAFSLDGSQIAYFGNKDGSGGIFISQPDGSSFKNILPNRLENAEVYWPSDNLIYFKTDTPNGSELYGLSIAGELNKILDAQNELEVKWSKDGSQLLFSQKTDSGLGLFYKNISSDTEIPLNIATDASKCDWSIDGKTIVCGVPKLSEFGDEIYEIGLDGTKKLLSSPTSRINTAELFLSGLDDYVVVLNSLNNKLYVLKK